MEFNDSSATDPPLYDANNPHGFLRKLTRHLKKYGLYRLGTGEETIANGAKTPLRQDKINWLKKTDKHIACLETSLGTHAAEVIKSDDPVDAWNALLAFVGHQLGTNEALLYKDLFNLKYDGTSGIEQHCKEILAKRDALVHSGEIVSDKLTIALLMNSVPSGKNDPFHAINAALHLNLSRRHSDVTSNFLISQLVSAEARLKEANCPPALTQLRLRQLQCLIALASSTSSEGCSKQITVLTAIRANTQPLPAMYYLAEC